MTIRYRLTTEARLTSPLHVGGLPPRGGDTPDGTPAPARLARTADGTHLLIPGTSLTGALRAWLRHRGADDAAVWGGTGSGAHPSSTWVDDIALPAPDPTPARHRNGIDRVTGAPAPGVLHAAEVLPAGTALSLTLAIDTRPAPPTAAAPGEPAPTPGVDEDAARTAVAHAAAALRSGTLQLGRGASHGQGRLRADTITVDRYDLSTLAGLTAWLAGEPSPAGPLESDDLPEPAHLAIEIAWTSPTGLLTADPDRRSDGDGHDNVTLPLHEPRAGGTPGPVVLGSSIKGALRARASRIARTVLDHPADWGGQPLRAQIATDDPLTTALFGATGAQAALHVEDLTPATTTSQSAMRVALDRWTGGAVAGRLYEVALVTAPEWPPIRLVLYPQRLSRDPDRQAAALCLLGLVLAELATSTVQLGSGGARGLGAVRVRQITLTSRGATLLGPDAEQWALAAPEHPGSDGSLRAGTALARALLAKLTAITPPGGWHTYLAPTVGQEDPDA